MRPELDFYQIDALYSEDERMVRDSVRSFIKERFMPVVQQHYRAGTFPRDLVPELASLGLLGPTMKGYGGAGVSVTAYGLIMQELERGDSGIRSFCSVQSGLVIYPIATFGDEAQRERWLPKLIGGEMIGCFGLTEPDFGSNPSGMRTVAKRDGDSYVLDGAKRWITNGDIADVAVVFARVDDGSAADGERLVGALRRRARHAGLLDARDRGQAVAARIDHQRALLRGVPDTGREPARGR